jgi:small-conductance mechanosensitive channel/CRP-like cAMP-binding protein
MFTQTLAFPAIICLGAYLALIVFAQILRRVWPVRFGWTYHVFALASGALAALLIASPWTQETTADAVRNVSTLVIISAACQVIVFLRGVLMHGRSGLASDAKAADAVPRVLIDTAAVVIMALALLVIVGFVYKKPITGFVAGSGVVAIIVGLAMQDLLSNIFAGIAIHIEKSYQVGDWLVIDGKSARVIEISWRATRLLTFDDVRIEVPNSYFIRNAITDFEKPTPQHAARVLVRLHYNVPPLRVKEVLREAAASVPGLVPGANITVLVKEFSESCIIYEIKFFVENHSISGVVQSDVRASCWYAARRAGMEMPFPQVTFNRPAADTHAPAANARATAARMLGSHPIFGFLSAAQIDELVKSSPVLLFCANDSIVRQGDAGYSMFFIIKGAADVRIAESSGSGSVKTVAQLKPGDCVGEMSLLTGAPRSATVMAASEIEAVEITKDIFASLLKNNPDIVARLGELLDQRQRANELTATSQTPFSQGGTARQTRETVLRRLRQFFSLDN